ncbi:MAG: ABC transporter ATP-binding protein [Bacilli bacterium]|nr:ABC transporter ATP-binding protein [Bacilli bacterium]
MNPNQKTKQEKAKDFKGTLKKLISCLKPYRIKIIIVLIFGFGSAAFSIVGPKILGKATTEIFNSLVNKVSGTGESMNFNYIGKILLILVGLYVISAIFSFVQGFITTGITQKLSYKLRKDISEKINKLPLKYFDKKTHGEVLSVVTNDIDTVNQTLNDGLSTLVTSITTIIGVFIMMMTISPLLTGVSVLVLPIAGILFGLFIGKSQKHFQNQQKYLGEVNGNVEEMYGGHLIVKAFNGEEKASKNFEVLNNKLYNSAWKSQFLSGMMMPLMTFVGNLGYVAVTIVGGYLTVKKTIQVGDILSFIQYVRSFMQPVGQTASVVASFQSTVAAAERVFIFLEEPEEIQTEDTKIDDSKIKGSVVFDKVHFGYNNKKIIINDFSATIKAGQKIAIVGPTGAGKTTIVKLLMRFYELNKGAIYVDGYDIKKINRNKLRTLFGMVLQDTWLFNGTIMDNIKYAKADATEAEIIEASKAAQIDHFIHTLPDGYEMILNEEVNNISQGQKQLLTIARAILLNPKILILDEATSSVDTRTEILIQKAMENLMKDRTSFIIAHRLSTIKNADLILVMDNGDIVEQGTHQQLLKKNGFYASLYNSQFETDLSN